MAASIYDDPGKIVLEGTKIQPWTPVFLQITAWNTGGARYTCRRVYPVSSDSGISWSLDGDSFEYCYDINGLKWLPVGSRFWGRKMGSRTDNSPIILLESGRPMTRAVSLTVASGEAGSYSWVTNPEDTSDPNFNSNYDAGATYLSTTSPTYTYNAFDIDTNAAIDDGTTFTPPDRPSWGPVSAATRGIMRYNATGNLELAAAIETVPLILLNALQRLDDETDYLWQRFLNGTSESIEKVLCNESSSGD